MTLRTKTAASLLLIALVSCGQAGSDGAPFDPASTAAEVDASVGGANGEAGARNEAGAGSDADVPALVLPAICTSDTKVPPSNLVCTGLYADIDAKQIAPGIEGYTPAVPLWSDGAEKKRWVSLPVGQVIDNSNPNEWSFPVGTKFWKEFSVDGSRIETRLWQKTDPDYWVDTTYAWNAKETGATRSAGGDISLPSRSYHIPTGTECTKCHRGRTDRILGFDQVLMGLKGAVGFTLERLIAEHRLSNPPEATPLAIGDDGTGRAAPALAWLHVNCGTTCRNRNSNATAYSTKLFLRLDPTQLDGRAVTQFDPLLSTIGVSAVSPDWKGQTRITPSSSAQSLVYQLISHRGTGMQMPPFATSLVDTADIALIEAWISHMPQPHVDAGTGDPTGMDETGTAAPPGPVDGQPNPSDASMSPPDPGLPAGNASANPVDASAPSGDASMTLADAGVSMADGSVAASDASTEDLDAGSSLGDPSIAGGGSGAGGASAGGSSAGGSSAGGSSAGGSSAGGSSAGGASSPAVDAGAPGATAGSGNIADAAAPSTTPEGADGGLDGSVDASAP